MSEENAELLRRAVEAYNRRDIEALVAELDPEVEWHPALPGLIVGAAAIYRGHDGIAEMFRDFYEVLDEIQFEYSEIHDLGDRVVAIGRDPGARQGQRRRDQVSVRQRRRRQQRQGDSNPGLSRFRGGVGGGAPRLRGPRRGT